jgi:hypothetical protein
MVAGDPPTECINKTPLTGKVMLDYSFKEKFRMASLSRETGQYVTTMGRNYIFGIIINLFFLYTVTRPYEGFRHPDWMAPESSVRGRENDSLVRPGYIHPQIPSFSGGYGIFRRFSL